jgi:hypothetical protein
MTTDLQTKTATIASGLEQKSMPALGVKVLDDEKGIAELWVSTTGIVDHGKDLIEAGAYAETIKARKPKGAYHHDLGDLVSKALAFEEVPPGDMRLPARVKALGPKAGAVRVEAQYNLATQKGRDAWEELKFYGDEQEFSIGYATRAGDATFDAKTGVRTIHSLEWYEWSHVPFGMAPGTGTTAMKSLDGKGFTGSFEDLRDRVMIAVRDLLLLAADGDRRSYAYAIATYPDRVVVCVYEVNGDETYWQVPYVDDGTTISLGVPTEVEVEQVIVTKARAAHEVEQKAGRVLSATNVERLRTMQTAITELLDAAGEGEGGDEKVLAPTAEGAATEGAGASADDATGDETPENGEKLVPVDVAAIVREQSELEAEMLDR